MIMKNIEQSCFEVDLKIYTVTEEFYLRTSLIFLGRAVCNNDDDIETLVITSPSPRNENMIEKEAFYEEQLKKESFFAKITNVVDAITVYIQDVSSSYELEFRCSNVFFFKFLMLFSWLTMII